MLEPFLITATREGGTRKGHTVKTIKIATIAKTATLAAVAGTAVLGLAGPANAVSGTMYGDPAAAAKYWSHQEYDDCVIMSTADVVGEVTGKKPSEHVIIKMAQSTPSTVHPGSIYVKPADTEHPNSGHGASMADVPTLLAQYNVDSVISTKDDAPDTGVPAGIEGIERALGSGHKVIVLLNAELIWNQPVEVTDKHGNPRGDHAVVVTGVDTANNVVHLNDSGNPDGRDEQIPINVFMKAWNASDQLVVVTT
jgi:hypothetical protein